MGVDGGLMIERRGVDSAKGTRQVGISRTCLRRRNLSGQAERKTVETRPLGPQSGVSNLQILGDQLITHPQLLQPRIWSPSQNNMGLFTRGVSWKICRSSLSVLGAALMAFAQHGSLASTSLDHETNPQRPKEREADLNAAIQALDLAKTSSILPAKAVFASVAVLLTMIRVRVLLFLNGPPQAHTYPGLNDQQIGLRRARAILRQCLSNA
jgi:hypothetical protein